MIRLCDGRTDAMSWRPIAASLVIVSVAAGLPGVTPAHAGNVSVGVNIGVPVPPPPPVMIAEPPRVVVVPGSPVYYAPGVDFNLFVYHQHYYRFHEGAWFIASSHGEPWTHVVQARVPQPVLAVPVTYYRIPPGHAQRIARPRVEHRGKGEQGGKHD